MAYEIITRHEAFSDTAIAPSLVILSIGNSGQKPEERIVDEVEHLLEESEADLTIFATIKDIMKQCWVMDPEKRPSASAGSSVITYKKSHSQCSL